MTEAMSQQQQQLTSGVLAVAVRKEQQGTLEWSKVFGGIFMHLRALLAH